MIARERRAVALVSHKLAEVLHATDEIMRHGRVVDRLRTADASAAALARAMVGREVSLRTSAAALGAITLTETGELDAPETEPPTVDAQAPTQRMSRNRTPERRCSSCATHAPCAMGWRCSTN